MKKLIWTGAMLDPSGYGEASRGYLQSLAREPDLQIKIKPRYFWNGSSIGRTEMWPLLQKMHDNDLDRDQPHLYIQHLTPDQWAVGYGMAYHVGVTTFETDSLPYHWKLPMRAMDELWTFSTWSAEIFEDQGIRRPIWVMPHGVDTDRFKPGLQPLECLARAKDPGEAGPIGTNTYVFGSNFDWTERKNPVALLKAYFTTFRPDEDVALVLKVYHQYPIERSRMHVRQQIERIRSDLQLNKTPLVVLLEDIMPTAALPRFYAALDAYVLPSRGEGWGLTYSEAMASGLPTIGTGWSGNTEFMNDNNSLLLHNYKLVEISAADAGSQRQYVGHKWADVDLDELRATMRWCFDNRQAAADIGKAAREYMTQMYTWDHAGKAMAERIRQIR